MNYFIGVLFLALGIWQFYITFENFQRLRKKSNSNSSRFMPLALVFSILFGLAMIGMAAQIFFK